MNQPDDLLRPTLTGSAGIPQSMYSARTGYLAGFFGGPFAAIIVGAANSVQLMRLNRDWPLYAAIVAITVALFLWEFRWGGSAWITAHAGEGAARYVFRVAGLLSSGAIYLMHREAFRNVEMAGISTLPGWRIGIGAIVAGVAAMMAIGLLLT